MMDVNRPMLAVAGLCGAIGVGLAAMASHSANGDMAIAASFLQLHAPVMIGLSLLAGNRIAAASGWVLLLGLVLFAGDLVVRTETGAALFRFAAPAGGGLLILGWLLVVASAFGGRRRA